jgi:hypothetical protein
VHSPIERLSCVIKGGVAYPLATLAYLDSDVDILPRAIKFANKVLGVLGCSYRQGLITGAASWAVDGTRH